MTEETKSIDTEEIIKEDVMRITQIGNYYFDDKINGIKVYNKRLKQWDLLIVTEVKTSQGIALVPLARVFNMSSPIEDEYEAPNGAKVGKESLELCIKCGKAHIEGDEHNESTDDA